MDEEIKIIRTIRIESWEGFEKLLRVLLEEIYGSAERGMKIYEEKYGAITYYKNYRVKKNSYLLLAEIDGEIVGFLYGRKFRNYSYLYDIAVLPEHRGKGVGRKLVEEFVSLVGPPIYADVQENAVEFFKKLNFRILSSYEEDGVIWYEMVRED